MVVGKEYIAICGDAGDGKELFDVAELVRCRDCKYFESKDGHFQGCQYFMSYIEADDFCSYGERIDNE